MLHSKQQPVRSHLARGLQTLQLVAESPRTAADVGALLSVNRSTALRLLQELERAGFVTRRQDKRFASVPERLAGLAGRGTHEATDTVARRACTFRDAVHESTNFSVPAGLEMVYVSYNPSPHAVTVSERLGTLRPMYCSAIGRAYMAGLEPDQCADLVRRLSLTGGTSFAPGSLRELNRRIAEARERGYAVEREETLVGVSCTAIAVGRPAPFGAVGVSAPSSRLDEPRLHEVAHRLVEAFTDMHAVAL